MAQRTTIVEIAQRVGMTDGTVSRALRGSTRVKEATRRKVLQVAREMGYRSHAGGRFLSTGKTFTFGLISPSLRYPLNAEICECLQQQLSEIGYGLMVTSLDNHDEIAVSRLRILSEHCVDGIILQPTMSKKDVPCFQTCQDFGVPFVVSANIPGRRMPFVSFDDYQSTYQMTRHILDQGYRKPALVTSWSTLSGNQHLIDGFRQALSEFQVDPDRCPIRSQEEFTSYAVRGVLDELLSPMNSVDAIILSDVTTAMHAYHILRDRGLRLGENFAMASLDDAPWLDEGTLSISSLHYSIPDLSRRLIAKLLRQIEHQEEPEIGEYIKPTLRPRATTKRRVSVSPQE